VPSSISTYRSSSMARCPQGVHLQSAHGFLQVIVLVMFFDQEKSIFSLPTIGFAVLLLEASAFTKTVTL